MNKHKDNNGQDFADRSDRDLNSLLMKIQRQLTFIENKIDRLSEQIQSNPHKEHQPVDYRMRKKPFSKASTDSKPRREYGKKKHQEKKGEKERHVPFYSKFQKGGASAGTGSRKRTAYPKRKKKE